MPANVARSAPVVILGQFGMKKVNYLGDSTVKIRGNKTCHWYEFGSDRKVCWVDLRDVPHVLSVTYNDQVMFETM